MITIRPPAAVGSASPTDTPGPTASEIESGFRVSTLGRRSGIAADLATPPLSSAVEPGLILTLQEQVAGTTGQGGPAADRDARRRGKDLIEALAALQRALLGGEGELACLARLTNLLESVPAAHDPALGHLVAAIQLRGEIEALRQIRRLNPG